MKRVALVILFCSGALIGLVKYFSIDRTTFAFMAFFFVLFIPVLPICLAAKSRSDKEERAKDAIEIAQGFVMARKEIRSRIPKNNPRRESNAAFEGAAKIGAVRSMAALLRKPGLRMIVLDVCDFADMVLETIRRMPCDSPAAVSFSENLLARLVDSIDLCFKSSGSRRDKPNTSSIADIPDAQEIECFSLFITAIKKQQDLILFEGQGKG
ncbi:MAG: hypothetical protein LBI74_06745 [Synergistaceae bacterium]|nr:hypothetical protein [Synergistaceae bacterium]